MFYSSPLLSPMIVLQSSVVPFLPPLPPSVTLLSLLLTKVIIYSVCRYTILKLLGTLNKRRCYMHCFFITGFFIFFHLLDWVLLSYFNSLKRFLLTRVDFFVFPRSPPRPLLWRLISLSNLRKGKFVFFWVESVLELKGCYILLFVLIFWRG